VKIGRERPCRSRYRNQSGGPPLFYQSVLAERERGMFVFGNDLIGILILLLDIWAIVGTLQSGATPVIKLIWVLLVLVLPVVGFVLWFLIGPGAKTLPGRGRRI
jgi:hypothetical protein